MLKPPRGSRNQTFFVLFWGCLCSLFLCFSRFACFSLFACFPWVSYFSFFVGVFVFDSLLFAVLVAGVTLVRSGSQLRKADLRPGYAEEQNRCSYAYSGQHVKQAHQEDPPCGQNTPPWARGDESCSTRSGDRQPRPTYPTLPLCASC